jgi:hypothetical protein
LGPLARFFAAITNFFGHCCYFMDYRFVNGKNWGISEIITIFHNMIVNFEHKETGKYLDGKM